MANDVYNTVGKSIFCARNPRTNLKQGKLRLFLPAGFLDFVAIDIIDPSPWTESGNKYVLVMTDRYYKLR